ncbi:MAG: Holliday junction DNA helicase RuvA [Candidatus Omnitrophica bacterium]|nr:Holliday junction DNA helicase RuvA [Candidatus Omnitrophota bacterium]
MISRVSGKIIERGQNYLIIEVSGISYEVLLPSAVIERLPDEARTQGDISLITYHYLQVEPSRSTPVLIGFLNEIEKEFFEIFITVSGIGPKAALRALSQPISSIARAIDEGDVVFLKSLPGIGQQRAKEIVAKLQNKVGKFALIQDGTVKERGAESVDIQEEALDILIQLQYKKPEALLMIKKARERHPDIETTQELLNEVYKQKKAR